MNQPQQAQAFRVSQNEEVILILGMIKTTKGREVCLGVSVLDFRAIPILSMQYSILWDPKILRLEKVESLNFPGLSPENFGMSVIDRGHLTFVWIDSNLNGIQLRNGDELYRLCFEAIGDPTPMEVVTVYEKIIPLNVIAGSVTVE